MLALNAVDAYSLQVNQTLILPPLGNGRLPSVSNARTSPEEAAPPAAVVEPAQSVPATDMPAAPTATNAPAGVPFAPTPPFVAFTSPTATPTPTATQTPEVTPTPTATPTIGAGERAWLTSSEEAATHYHCDLDTAWQSIAPEKLLAFDSEQQLLAVWGRFRVKAPDSVC